MTSPSHAIADTSYLSALCRIGLLEILRLRFPQVTIPGAVLEELNTAADEIIRNEIGQALQAGWIRIAEPANPDWQPPVSRLGAGETAALALATETQDAILLMDERRGRNASRILGIPTTGVMGLLIWAKQEGHIETLAAAIHDLQSKDRFFIDPELVRQALHAVGEN